METLALIGLIGGLITGVSPCVLPMLPVIFFSVDRRPSLIILGLVTSFSLITLLGSLALSALGLPDSFLRWTGLVILVLVGLGMIFEPLGHLIERPFYRLPKVTGQRGGAFVFGLGLGTLYVPCAGPILAAITVAGATGRIGWSTVVLTISFAIGAAIPLFLFALAGNNIRQRIGAFRSHARAFRVTGGLIMLVLAVGFAFNVTSVLQRATPAYTAGIEKKLAESDAVQGALTPFATDENRGLDRCTPGDDELANCGPVPELRGTQEWFNTGGDEVALADLRGKVVLIDFWAYSCINCQRDAPHINEWYETYADSGLEVIGVHSPEFAFEKSAKNVRSAIEREDIQYPVVQDNDLATWTAFRNRYWPAKYLVDEAGTVRAIKFGEGDYAQTETLIRELLRERDASVDLPDPVEDDTTDAELTDDRTPELYLSAFKSAGYAGMPRIGKTVTEYVLNPDQPADTFSLGGTWRPEQQFFASTGDSRIRLHYRGKDVYHVLAGSGTVTISEKGRPDRVIEVSGTPNLYPIVESDANGKGTITLEYSKGIEAYTFSFG